MLVVAAGVLVALGIATLVLVDPPDVDGGWLRAVFGKVFGTVAIGLGAVLGVPSAMGLWAMSGATKEDAVPALPRPARRLSATVGVGTAVVTAIVLVVTGSAVAVLNVGLAGLVALASLGLAGAAAFSPHRWRAAASGVALVAVALGTLWLLGTAFIGRP